MIKYENCTCCGRELNDLKIEVILNTKASRYNDLEEERNIPNVETTNREILCKECFDKFCDTLMNFKGSLNV